jgi:hypothetical protein
MFVVWRDRQQDGRGSRSRVFAGIRERLQSGYCIMLDELLAMAPAGQIDHLPTVSMHGSPGHACDIMLCGVAGLLLMLRKQSKDMVSTV